MSQLLYENKQKLLYNTSLNNCIQTASYYFTLANIHTPPPLSVSSLSLSLPFPASIHPEGDNT